MKIEISKVVGSSTGKGWSQVHTFTPEEKEKLTSRGQLLAVITLANLKQGIEVTAAGKEIISRLHEEYYGSLEARPLTQLKAALEKVCQEANQEAKIEITAACLVDNVLYLAVFGEGKIIFRRQQKVVTLLAGKESSLSAETASGYLKEGDLFLLGTGKFFSIVAWGVIQAALATNSIFEAAEILAPIVHGWEEGGLAAAVLAKTEEKPLAPPPEPKIRPSSARVKRVWSVIKDKAFRLIQRQERPPRSKKTIFTVALVLFLLLGMSVVLGGKQRKHLSQEKKISGLLQQARQKKEEAEALATLNPTKAKESFSEAQLLVNQIEEGKLTSEELNQFKKELETAMATVLKEYSVSPQIFFDLELIRKGASVGDFSFSNNQIVILDKGNSAVYTIGIKDKKSTIFTGGKELTEAVGVIGRLPKVYVLTKKGILQSSAEDLSAGTQKQSLVVKADGDWGELLGLEEFSGNLYLLTDKTVWLFSGTESAFEAKKNWLKSEGKDFSGSLSFKIDGSVWILEKEGTISKFTRGVKNNFQITGMDKPLVNPQSLFTDINQKDIYVLDRLNDKEARLVGINKSGEYDFQAIWGVTEEEGLGEIFGLIVLEEEKQVFLLAKSKIYEFKLR